MPLTAQQICTRACQIAHVPGFITQAGDSLNVVLNELCQDYDFDLAKKTFLFNFNTSALNFNGQAYQNLPADYLRGIRNESFYMVSGVPYPMIPMDLNEIDMLVQQAGVSNFPIFYTVDMSRNGMVNSTTTGPGQTGVPVALFWMTPSGAYAVTMRYFSQMPEIATASTSSDVPWFPNQNYLITRIAGEMMKDSDDDRNMQYLANAKDILTSYLKMKDDKGDRAQVVTLDRRRFGRAFDRLKNTKQIGW